MMTELMEAVNELDAILTILEAKLPGNVAAPENQKLVNSLEREMKRYFRAIDLAIPVEDLNQLYYRLVKPEIVTEGGPGSGHFGHTGRPGEVGGSGEGGQLSARAERAKTHYKCATAAVQRQAEKNEPRLAKAVNGKVVGDNEEFDVISGEHAFEIKTIVRGENNKITMHGDSLSRKQAFLKKTGAKPHTVVFDDRSGKIYYKEGLGSFRLKAMKEISLDDLRGITR